MESKNPTKAEPSIERRAITLTLPAEVKHSHAGQPPFTATLPGVPFTSGHGESPEEALANVGDFARELFYRSFSESKLLARNVALENYARRARGVMDWCRDKLLKLRAQQADEYTRATLRSIAESLGEQNPKLNSPPLR